MWSIGELAEQAGVTVKTVRFYSDRGLLPETARSAGGHRRYGPEALDRLRLIRSLRTLDLPVPDVGRVLEREDALGDVLEDVVAGQLRELGPRLAALRWREAALHLLRDCAPEERPERLRLLGSVTAPPSTAAPARFWRSWLPARVPARLASAIVDTSIPQPPADPTPAQVLAFARLHALLAGIPHPGADYCQPAHHRPELGYDLGILYDGLTEAAALAAPALRARRSPHEGEALDCFVAAHARARGLRDTPDFRHRLSHQLAGDPYIGRYWELHAELSGHEPTLGAVHDWLRAALDSQAARTEGQLRCCP
ncbi:MerR family transcriptional regulator [Streptomyces violens]|uniref:helix-turn-helix domain-containing protein n=1 Tax=Streptomyces violens TaxID=66377 RepID=UPI000996B006